MNIKKCTKIHNISWSTSIVCSCESITISNSVKYLEILICISIKWKNQINI